MGFVEAVQTAFSRYFDFSGRSMRSEYWYFVLFLVLLNIVSLMLDGAMGYGLDSIGPFGIAYVLATLIPSLSVSVRRLHDIDMSGWWLLIMFIPIAGWIMVIIWACQDSAEKTRFDDGPSSQVA